MNGTAGTVPKADIFFEWIAQAVQADANFFEQIVEPFEWYLGPFEQLTNSYPFKNG